MIKIGVTGGMGTGKSLVCAIFRLHDIPVFDADKEAKYLNDTSPLIRAQIIRHFGEELYSDDKLDRKKFASLIFQDKEKMTIANAIIHPVLTNYFTEWCHQHNDHPFVVIDAALLIEAGFLCFVDIVITVSAPEDIRMERVMQRDHTRRSEVEARMNNQLSEEEKIKVADFVIYNDNHHSLIRQVDDFLKSHSIE